MLIPLTDPIWSRLYGPYGVENVPSQLSQLEQSWDQSILQDLFWERLHHQNDLYPVTFAALPWLKKLWAENGKDLETLMFFSHVLYCATLPWGTGSDGQGPRGKYRGLSTRLEDHALDWIPKQSRLIETDMQVLVALVPRI